MLVGSAISALDSDLSAVRRRVVGVLRQRLVPEYVAADRFAHAFDGWAEQNRIDR